MSNLFMDVHRGRRCRGHCNQKTSATSASVFARNTTTTPDSPSSTEYLNDQIFNHYNNNSVAAAHDAAHIANYDFGDREKCRDHRNGDDEDYDAFANILSLKLKKPKHWKWELSTSKSCSSIALPRILLYDHKGTLLVDAQGNNEGVFKQGDAERPKPEKRPHQTKTPQKSHCQRSYTTSLTHSIGTIVEQELNGLHIEEVTPSPERFSNASISSHRSRKAISFNITDLPDCGPIRRSSSLRGVRFDVKNDKCCPVLESQIPEFLPTPPSTTTHTSSSSGPQEKRKYRRSQSSSRSSAHSESILERFSYQKGRFSSPEYADEMDVEQRPCYFLRTCKAGTLVVKEDSFSLHPRRRRRRPLKNRSTNSLENERKTTFYSTPSKQNPPIAGNSSTSSDTSRNGVEQRISHKQLSTSEENAAAIGAERKLMKNIDSRHLRKNVRAHNQTQGDLSQSEDVYQKWKT